jgi:hypothetical protein
MNKTPSDASLQIFGSWSRSLKQSRIDRVK